MRARTAEKSALREEMISMRPLMLRYDVRRVEYISPILRAWKIPSAVCK